MEGKIGAQWRLVVGSKMRKRYVGSPGPLFIVELRRFVEEWQFTRKDLWKTHDP
jgi:hypothetical protein